MPNKEKKLADTQEALVIRSTGSWYDLIDKEGNRFKARTRGKLRLQGSKATNPIAVGDVVLFSMEDDGEQALISDIKNRKNYIIRKSNNLSKQTQVIAANLDLLALVVTPVAPATSTGFIDRFLLTSVAYDIPALLVFNKTDLFDDLLDAQVTELENLYRNVGFDTIRVSAKNETGLNELKDKLKEKTSLFSGHSGVGKSSILNKLFPQIDQKTGVISDYSLKGKHTTTFAEMFEPEPGFKLIDTPGIKDFGVVNLEQAEISHYFPEMRSAMSQCKFNNCLHIEEPGCAILQALENGNISPSRYYSYLSILGNEDVHH